PGATSPYAPNSRLFLNPLYIDVEAIEEFDRGAAPDANALAQLRDAPLVDYGAVADLKLKALRAAYRAFAANGSTARRHDFDDYRRQRGRALQCFAAFETLRTRHAGAWWEWPDEWRKPDDEAMRQLREREAEEFGFHEYLQWNAERQLQRCRDIAARRG